MGDLFSRVVPLGLPQWLLGYTKTDQDREGDPKVATTTDQDRKGVPKVATKTYQDRKGDRTMYEGMACQAHRRAWSSNVAVARALHVFLISKN